MWHVTHLVYCILPAMRLTCVIINGVLQLLLQACIVLLPLPWAAQHRVGLHAQFATSAL